MKEIVESIIRQLFSAPSVFNLYPKEHSLCINLASDIDELFKKFFYENNSFAIGVVNYEIVYQDEVYFKLSQRFKDEIDSLVKAGVSKIVFRKGLSKKDISVFVDFLLGVVSNNVSDAENYFRLKGISNVVVGDIECSSHSKIDFGNKFFVPKDIFSMYEEALKSIEGSIESMLEMKALDSQALKGSILGMVDNLASSYNEFLNLSTVKKYDQVTYKHMLSVALLSMNFAAELGYKEKDLIAIGIAALFHDIGKIYISRKVLSKPDKLDNAEFKQIQNHSRLGAELMLNYVDSLGVLPVVVAFEHHVKFNGAGYPKLVLSHKIHFVSKLVSICDVYDALVQRRSYKRDYPPELVYKIMQQGSGSSFDPELLDKFFKIRGLWPIDTIVELSDKSIGVVTALSKDFFDKPVVKLVFPNEVIGESVDLQSDCNLTIMRSLNPLSEGKEYTKK